MWRKLSTVNKNCTMASFSRVHFSLNPNGPIVHVSDY